MSRGKGAESAVERRTVLVPIDQMLGFDKQLKSLNKKAAAFGLPLIRVLRSVQRRYRREIQPLGRSGDSFLSQLVPAGDGETLDHPVLIQELEIEYPLIRLGKWQVVGEVEKVGDDSIALCTSEQEDDAAEVRARRTHLLYCEHCATRRSRQSIFVVKELEPLPDDGKPRYRQVGRNCLMDYTGIDPAAALFLAKMHEFFRESDELFDSYGRGGGSNAIETTAFLRAVWFLCERGSFISSKKAKQTGDTATWESALGLHRALSSDPESQQVYENARAANPDVPDQIVAWVGSAKAVYAMSADFAANCKAVLAQPALPLNGRHLGIAAAAVAAFRTAQARERDTNNGQHLGAVGEYLSLDLKVRRVVEVPNAYSRARKYVVLLEDETGNILKWLSSSVPPDIASGKRLALRGRCKVKKHSFFNEVRQTEIERLKVEAWRELSA